MKTTKLKEWFDEAREKKKLTVEAFADLVGIHEKNLYNIMHYKKPVPKKHLKLFSKALGKDPGMIGLMFGYLPEKFVEAVREQPEVMYEKIKVDGRKRRSPKRRG